MVPSRGRGRLASYAFTAPAIRVSGSAEIDSALGQDRGQHGAVRTSEALETLRCGRGTPELRFLRVGDAVFEPASSAV